MSQFLFFLIIGVSGSVVSDLAVGPTFKLCLRTAEASKMTVRTVADVVFALCQAFYKGIRL